MKYQTDHVNSITLNMPAQQQTAHTQENYTIQCMGDVDYSAQSTQYGAKGAPCLNEVDSLKIAKMIR